MKTSVISKRLLFKFAISLCFSSATFVYPLAECLYDEAWAHEATVVHPGLAGRSFTVLNNSFNSFYTLANQNEVRGGAVAEDNLFSLEIVPRFLNHFYNPVTGKKGIGGTETALERAVGFWHTAVALHIEEVRTGTDGAFHYLGRVLHLLQDMTSPAHVHDDPHGQILETCVGDIDDFERFGWCPAINSGSFPQYTDSFFSSVKPIIPPSRTPESFIHLVATLTYNASSFEGELIAGVNPQPSDNELAIMFPGQIFFDNGGILSFGHQFWRINNVGDFFGGINGDDAFGFNDDWWAIENSTRENDIFGNAARIKGKFYLENAAGHDSVLTPKEYKKQPNVTGFKTLLSYYGDELYTIAVEYGAGLLQLFQETVSGTKAVLTTPTPGSTLPGSAVTFAWSAGSGALRYWLTVGLTPGGRDLYNQPQGGLVLAATVTGLPTDGRTLYVGLWTELGVSGNWGVPNAYTYTAASSPGGGGTPGAFSVNAFAECSGSSPAIRLSWSISSNATSFEVHRNGALLVGNLPNSTGSYVDTSVSAGTTYTYFIRARNGAGFTDSNTVQFAAPTNCVFTLTAQPECSGTVSQIRLRWSVPPTGAGSYEVFRNGVSIFSTVNSNLTEYVNTGVSPGVSYNYFVRASTSVGLRDSTSASATALSCGTVLPGPFSLTAASECSGGNPQIRLTWTASAGADFYQVLRNGIILTGVSGTTFLDTAVTAGTTYNYVARAINSGGQTDSNTVSPTASCVTPPGAFTLTVTPWCTGSAPVNLLEWTGSVGLTFPYEVYRNGALVFTTDFGGYDDTAVTGGTSYSYVVRARNSVGSRDSNTVIGTAKTDCAAPVAPVITSISPQSVTVGDPGFTLTVTGSNFDQTAKILWGFSGGQPPGSLITPTFINSSTLTVQVTQDTGGFSPFSIPGVLAIQVLKPGPNFFDGQRSNTAQFTIFNPVPVISSITGTCQAGLNCVPSNGFDVRIFGSGFVNNSAFVGGSFVSSSTLEINGAAANMNLLGQGPAYTQMQLLANGSLIPTPGTYTVRVCNAGTSQGTTCSTGSLTVTP